MKEDADVPMERGDEAKEGTERMMVVGYALTSKKKNSFLKPDFEALASDKGILFVAIDIGKPLADQGPFDVVLHKILQKEWSKILEEYQQKNPEVTVVDLPDAIERLHNRQSMLEDVVKLNLCADDGKVGTPKQLVIQKDPQSIAHSVAMAGLKFPLVAKPLVVDGSAKSHELFLAYDENSLSELEPPVVLQEFVNHGGLVFKIYIIGEAIKVVRRFSLPNITEADLVNTDGIKRFPRVSSAAASAENASLDPLIALLPPTPLLEKLAQALRSSLGLHLFNIDMIREYGSRDMYYVIDINYFPGYGKMPDYENIFTDFLLQLRCQKKMKISAKSPKQP